MKKQVRLNTFETNSSTQHALVIRCKDKTRTIADGIPEGAQIPEVVHLYALPYKDVDNMKLNTIENRLLYLYNNLLSWDAEKADLISFLSRLSQLGIKYELHEYRENVYHDFPGKMIEEIMRNKDIFMAYVFADDIFYDTFEDDCGTLDEQYKWLDIINKFISESKDDTVYLKDRC